MMQSELQPLEILRTLGINGMPAITPVEGGFDMAMWKVEHEGPTYALRVFRVGAYEDCAYERVVMATALAAGLPVPEGHEAGVWQDRPALLITWLAGRTIEDELRCATMAAEGHWGWHLVACRRRSMQYPPPFCFVNGQMRGLFGNTKENRHCKIACIICLQTRGIAASGLSSA